MKTIEYSEHGNSRSIHSLRPSQRADYIRAQLLRSKAEREARTDPRFAIQAADLAETLLTRIVGTGSNEVRQARRAGNIAAARLAR